MSEDAEDSNDSGGTLVELSTDAGHFLQKLTGGALERAGTELGGLAGDWLRYQRLKLLTGRLEGAREMCREAGIENPGEVALSTLAPWIKGASIEDDPSLHRMWESLLANAGDPRDGQKKTHRRYVRILKQIEATEVKVLEALYRIDESGDESPIARPRYPDNDQIREAIQDVGFDDSMTEQRLNIAKINLAELGLCSRQRRAKELELMDETNRERRLGRLDPDTDTQKFSIRERPTRAGRGQVPETAESQEGPPRIHINDLGRAFYEACQPPEPGETSMEEEGSE